MNTLGSVLWLKLERTEHTISGFYSADGVSWTPVGSSIDISDLDKGQLNFNSWVGNCHGIFAEGKTVDFDLFVYKDGFSAQRAQGFNNYYGVQTLTKPIGAVVTNTTANGGWFMLGGVDLGDGQTKVASGIEVNVAVASAGSMEIWIDDIEHDGKKIATFQLNANGNSDTWQNIASDFSSTVTGQHDVFVRIIGASGSFFLNTIRFKPTVLSSPVTGTEGMLKKKLNVYPNPFQIEVNIAGTDAVVDYLIYDTAGRVLEKGIVTGNFQSVGSKLMPGVYLLKVTTSQSDTFYRIVKSN